MQTEKPIYLIGFMSSGKSTIGRKLAHILERTFIDLDSKIELETGLSIGSIFKRFGESYFRDIESQVLKSIQPSKFVMACGGGTPLNPANMSFMQEHGITVYLKTETGILTQRLSANRGKRPLITNLSDEELKAFVQKTISEREPIYNQAQFHFDSHRQKLHELVFQLR